MKWQEHITADPAILVGKPIIRGTRLAAEFILGLIAQGWSEQEIMRNYQLTSDQVRACVAYAQERLNERGPACEAFPRLNNGHENAFAP
jgi:uncharacterized protein (DUF433 family)